jgi:multicomponent Na+:H+ antiporter subunit D
MSGLVVAPVVLPLLSAAILALLAPARARTLSVVSATVGFAVALALAARVVTDGLQVAQFGDWPAPFGISFVADHLSAVMVVISGLMGAAVSVYALRDVDQERERLGYHPMFHVLLAGINGAFLTGDLFNLYVWYEVLLISSFVLLTLGGSRPQLEGGMKYVAINLFGSLIFLSAVGLLYGATGTLNLADLAIAVRGVPSGLLVTLSMLFLVAFGIKAAIFPLFFWLPASYHTPSVSVSAIFAAMLTKVGVYSLIRVFTLIFTSDVPTTHGLLAWIAMLTMLTGVLGAAAQNDIRKILSFHIISQIGYMILGLAIFTPLGLVGAVFYLVHHIVVKGNLFLIAGIVRAVGGSFDLARLGGLYKHRPALAVLFLIPAFSLAGFPPLSGFWAKLIVIRAGLEAGLILPVVVSLVVGLLTIYSMTKIWQSAFWAPLPEGTTLAPRMPLPLLLPVVVLAAITVTIGAWSGPFIAIAEVAAEGLLDPARYVTAVLGPEAAARLGGTP